MIIETSGNIFDSEAEMLVNPVNCVGVMGKGLALQFKKEYPDNYEIYLKECRQGNVFIGSILITETNDMFDKKRYIANLPTKVHWKYPSAYSFIQVGLMKLTEKINDLGIKSVAMPKIGCGEGGLEWDIVKSKYIVKAIKNIDHDCKVFLYE